MLIHILGERENDQGGFTLIQSKENEDTEEEFLIKNDAVYHRNAAFVGPFKSIYRPNQGAIMGEKAVARTKFRGSNWNQMNIVILSGSQYLRCYSPTGAVMDIPLPCEIDSIFSIGTGLILQRSHSNYDLEIPKLFSLFHPLEEPRPLSEIVGEMNNASINDSSLSWITDESICVREILHELYVPILVCWNKEKRQHIIWTLHEEKKRDIKESINLTEENKMEEDDKESNSERMEGEDEFSGDEDYYDEVLDNDHAIRSQICAKHIWSGLELNPVSKVFVAADLNGKPALYLHDSVSFVLLSLSCPLFSRSEVKENEGLQTAKVLFELRDVSAVVPISRKNNSFQSLESDILILNNKNQLFLYRGNFKLCQCFLENGSIPGNITDLNNHVANRVNIVMNERVVRVTVPNEFTSPLVILIFNAFQEILDGDICNTIQADILKNKYSLSNSNQIGHYSNDSEFQCLVNVLSQIYKGEKEILSESNEDEDNDITELDKLRQNVYSSQLASGIFDKYKGIISSFSVVNNASKNKRKFEIKNNVEEKSMLQMKLVKDKDHKCKSNIFFCIHLIYEDLKLSRVGNGLNKAKMLGAVLFQWASQCGLNAYADLYVRDFGTQFHSTPSLSYITLSVPSSPPNIYKWLVNILVDPEIAVNFPTLKTCKLSFNLTNFYSILSKGGLNSIQLLVLKMMEVKFNLHDLSLLPYGISLPIWEALRAIRENPPYNWPAAAYILIGREDLAASSLHASNLNNLLNKQIENEEFTKNIPSPSQFLLQSLILNAEKDDFDGLKVVEDGSKLRFGADRRVREVCNLLRSSVPTPIHIIPRPELTDHAEVAEQQKLLTLLSQRVMALPIGRGMLTLGSMRATFAEALPIPLLVLSGRLTKNDAVVSLTAGSLPSNATYWPEFHNGVAAGLRIAAGPEKLSRAWIIYNKPETLSCAHAGFLFAMGLHGHLNSLVKTDIYSYLNPRHDATTVAILLGLSSAKRGSKDPDISKSLLLHIPSLYGGDLSEIEQSSTVQTAALLGIGLLYQGTSHRLMTEFLIDEIGKKANTDRVSDRECYSLAAGIALGMVTLGIGNKKGSQIADLKLEDRLNRLMIGGKDIDSMKGIDLNNRSSRLYEGDRVNVNVTAPGAIIALSLMFIKSNNIVVASRLAVPSSHYLLCQIRPDFLCLRVLAHSLIMWSSVQPTLSWVESQITPFITNLFNKINSSDLNDSDEEEIKSIDTETILLAHANIIAGACMSIGIRFAGTANADAHKTLVEKCLYFKELREGKESRKCPNKTTLEACLSTAAVALAMVMAGTGDLMTLKLLRTIRWKTNGVSHGSHMAISSAIGLLFLAGGKATLGRSNSAIAALVTSFFPLYPNSTTDNKYHLQAARHLYVLAIENRYISVYDVDSGEPCFVNLEITLKETPEHSKTIMNKIAPCLIPEYETIESIKCTSSRYWGITLSSHSDLKHIRHFRLLFVKRKAGHLSYTQDSRGLRSILAWPFEKVLGQAKTDSTSDDPAIIAFSSYSKQLGGGENNFLPSVLYECLTNEKTEMINHYLSLNHSVLNIINGTSQFIFHDIWNLKIAISYYRSCAHDRLGDVSFTPLIQSAYVSSISSFILKKFQTRLDKNKVRLYLQGDVSLNDIMLNTTDPNSNIILTTYLNYFMIPFVQDSSFLSSLTEKKNVENFVSKNSNVDIESLVEILNVLK